MKIAVTGASGFLGRHILEALGQGAHEIVGCARTRSNDVLHVLDVTDSSASRQFISEFRPDVLVHLAALTDPDECERDPVKCSKINVKGTENLVNAISDDVLFVFVSTDYVFDGKSPRYTENSSVNPLNTYGLTKHLAENIVKTMHKQSLIVRLPMLYSDGIMCDRDPVALIKKQLSSGKFVHLDDYQIRAPTSAVDAAIAIQFLLESGQTGTFHVSSDELATKYAFAYKIAEIIDESSKILMRVVPNNYRDKAQRPRNSSMCTEKYKSTGGPELHGYSEVIPRMLISGRRRF